MPTGCTIPDITIEAVDALRSQLARLSAEKIAWMVEKRLPTGNVYQYFTMDEDSFWGWTSDLKVALKFADRESAEQICGECEDCYICEHLWPEGF